MRKWIETRARLLIEHQSTLAVSYGIYTLALGFSGIVQIGLMFFLARQLPTHEFGMVALLMISIPLTTRFVTLGSDIGLSIRIWKRPRTEQEADLGAMLSWTGATVLMLLCLILLYEMFVGTVLGPTFLLCALFAAAFRNGGELFQTMLRREGHVMKVGLVIIVRTLLFATVCIAALQFIERTAIAYLLGAFVAEALTAFWALFHMTRLYKMRFFESGSLGRWKELAYVGFPSIPGMAAVLILAAGDRFVISGVLGLAAAGIYALGQRLAEAMVQLIFVPFATAFGPYTLKLASDSQDDAFRMIARTALHSAYLGVIVLGLPAIAGKELILVFAGLEFAASSSIFLLAIAAVLVFQVSQVLSVYFSRTETLRTYMWIIIVAATVNFVLNIAAVHTWGIVGAAVVSLLVYDAVLIAIATTVRRKGTLSVSLVKLHTPLLFFGFYLAMVYRIDTESLDTLSAISLKFLLWLGLSSLMFLVSPELRALATGLVRKLHKFVTS
jgi:O-antigen/teichoic acid export membrane protein